MLDRGTVAVAVAGPIEDNHAILGRGQIQQAARLEILDHAAVAVQQHQGFAFALLYVVQPASIDRQELAGWRIVAFGLPCGAVVDQRRGCEPNENRGSGCQQRVGLR